MKRIWFGLVVLVPLGLAALIHGLSSTACGGDDLANCGNGKVERSEQCDCGTDPNRLPPGCTTVNGGANGSCSLQCRLRAVVTNEVKVHWTINGQSFLGTGSFDTCSDVRASYVRIRLIGAGDYFVERTNQSCGDYVAIFTHDPVNAPLPAGHYTVYAELQSSDGSPLAPPADAVFDLVEGPDNEVWLDFPLESFYGFSTMTGDLLYRLHWGTIGTRCADSQPSVATQSVVLSQGGVPLPGYPATGACSDSTATLEDLAPGSYDIKVEGFDSSSALTHCQAAVLKVGAGVQPAYQIEVPTLDASACD